jgi:hypothetical protein
MCFYNGVSRSKVREYVSHQSEVSDSNLLDCFLRRKDEKNGSVFRGYRPLLMFLLAGEYPTSDSVLQLSNPWAGGHLTPTFYSSLH